MAMGISTLITNWYTLFPRNPYARLAGLVPLAVLIGGMVLSGIDRYVYGYLYSPQTASNFSNDLRLVNDQLNDKTRGETTLVVGKQETAFYSVVAHYRNQVSVVEVAQAQPTTSTVIISRAARATNKVDAPSEIITSPTSHNADRFYIYKTDKK
jgi:hypothetical protein